MNEQQQADLEADAAILAIDVGLQCFFVCDCKSDWFASDPMTADELIAALTSLMGGRS